MLDLFEPLISIFQSSYVYTFFVWLLRPAWDDAIGRTIILTATGYFAAFSLFTGYFSRFARGTGGLSAQQMGFHWSDIITLFPAGLITIAKLSVEIPSKIIKFAIHAFAILVSHFIGITLAVLFSEPIIAYVEVNSNVESISQDIGLFIYFIAVVLLVIFQFRQSQTMPYRVLVLVLFALAMFFISISAVISDNPSVTVANNSVWYIYFVILPREIIVTLYTFLAIVSPFGAGIKVATVSVEEQMLSRVTYLTLQQPISSLARYQSSTEDENEPTPTVTWLQTWFTKPSQQVAIEPNVYDYQVQDDQYLYFLASLPRDIVLFEPGPQEDLFNGRLILINRDIIHAMELSRPRKLDTEHQESRANSVENFDAPLHET